MRVWKILFLDIMSRISTKDFMVSLSREVTSRHACCPVSIVFVVHRGYDGVKELPYIQRC